MRLGTGDNRVYLMFLSLRIDLIFLDKIKIKYELKVRRMGAVTKAMLLFGSLLTQTFENFSYEKLISYPIL